MHFKILLNVSALLTPLCSYRKSRKVRAKFVILQTELLSMDRIYFPTTVNFPWEITTPLPPTIQGSSKQWCCQLSLLMQLIHIILSNLSHSSNNACLQANVFFSKRTCHLKFVDSRLAGKVYKGLDCFWIKVTKFGSFERREKSFFDGVQAH